MPLIDYHDIDELKNLNEKKVWRAIEHHLEENSSLCRCRDCLLDAAALALNSLRPRYHVFSFHENLPPEEERSLHEEAKEAVREAFNKVSKKPHHI